MSEHYISSLYIEKLGHNIQEIRERALLNLLSKLERGFVYDNELARCKEILLKLFNWFKFESINYEDTVLSLIKRIFNTQSGQSLMNLFGITKLKEELDYIRNVIDRKHHDLIDDIETVLYANNSVMMVDVPPLDTDIPLSYRSDDTDNFNKVYSTATPIVGVVKQSASIEPGTRYENSNKNSFKNGNNAENVLCLPYYTLSWQPLVSPDRHVFQSVEDSLRNPKQPMALLNSCDFFRHVLLQDFPAEVFLQRPSIIMLFHDMLWSSPSSRITTAILICLEKLTKALKTRIHYYSDPATHNLKNNNFLYDDTPLLTPTSENSKDSNVTDREQFEETLSLMKKQISLQQYCLNTIISVFDYLYIPPASGDHFKRKSCQIGTNTALLLLHELVDILRLCVKKSIWANANDEVNKIVLIKINDVFIKFGEVLEHFRLEVISSDWNEDCRLTHLHLLVAFTNLSDNLVPIDKCDSIIPRNLKNIITNSILDPAFSRIFPNIHETLIQITKNFKSNFDLDSFKKYEQVNSICDSLTATIRFMRNSKNLPTIKNILLAKKAVKSLEFHKSTDFINLFLDICANKIFLYSFEEEILKDIDDVLVSLLSHKSKDIKHEVYKGCQKRIISTIGAKLNTSKASSPGSQILFLLRRKVLQEIIVHGTLDHEIEIQNFAEDILVHILKCKILVSDEIWQQAIQAFVPVLPTLICHVSRTSLGRAVLSSLDPDRSNSLNIPICEVIKGNVGLLFSENSHTREEAVSRLCWLLSAKRENHNLLPHINNLHDKALALICQLDRLIDYNRCKSTQHFYQPSGLHQVIDLLNSKNVEPVIRRSAVTQISVMVEDPILHSTFIEKNGVELIIKIMESALIENDYTDYPDSVIACISILKNICLYNITIRHMLSSKMELYQYLLRGMFMFCTEERVKQDGSILLFLLVFANYILGSPLKNDLSLPMLILNKLKCPFICNSHWKVSENSLPMLFDLTTDKWALSSLQIHWNVEWFGGLNQLLKLNNVKYEGNMNFDNILKLKKNDLLAVKSTSVEYMIEKYLNAIANCDTHKDVINYVNKLTNCIHLFNVVKTKTIMFSNNITSLNWEETFDRYLNTPPSGSEDHIILGKILQFLSLLAPIYKNSDKHFWICSLLKSQNHYLSELVASDSLKETEVLQLMHSLFDLIIACILNDQYRLDFYTSYNESDAGALGSWNNLTKIIVEYLQFNDAQHYYNLSYLDHLLSTLVHLTSSFGWSGSKSDERPKKFVSQLTEGLCELIGAFHCGKGSSAADSVMGLSITRNILLILNHVVAELLQFKVMNWEECFIEHDIHINGGSSLANLSGLILSRDVILRAAVLHLLAGIAKSAKASIELVQDVKIKNLDIWEFTLSILLDHDEANTVRENAALLLANLLSHTILVNDEFMIMKSVLPKNSRSNEFNGIEIILNLFNDNRFYVELNYIFKNLYTDKFLYYQDVRHAGIAGNVNIMQNDSIILYNTTGHSSGSISSNGSKTEILTISTPGLIKNVNLLLYNLLMVSPTETANLLQEYGIIKFLLRCLTVQSIDIEITKDIGLYCEILEMNTSVCTLLTSIATRNTASLVTICNTRDCLNVMLSLLNTEIYLNTLPQLVYLRNKLWCSIFNLIEVILINSHNEIGGLKSMEAFSVITSIIADNGHESFLQSLCESISNKHSNELQLSALSSLTSLLRMETDVDDEEENKSHKSMQTLLDFTKTPRTPRSESMKRISAEMSKLSVLENAYFGNLCKNNENVVDDIDKFDIENYQMAGAELCSILLHLYDIITLKNAAGHPRKRTTIINALTSLLLVSNEAKSYALKQGLLPKIINQFKEIYIKLSLETVDCLRRVNDKKRVCPVLKELEALVGLITNFLYSNVKAKSAAAALGMADVCHKLWVWFSVQKPLLISGLKMLCTFTTECTIACQTIPLTSSVAGSSLRKVPSNVCLLQVICTQVAKEMEQISRTHDLTVLRLCFHLLYNCMSVVDCRIILLKNNLLQCVSRLHPAITKNQKPWKTVELIWLEFLCEFSSYPEGQSSLAKLPDILDLITSFTTDSKQDNKQLSMEILRNLAFYLPNRPRLLTSDDFINVLNNKIMTGSLEEKNMVVSIIWALAANNQKAKLVFKCAHLDDKLQEVIKIIHLSNVDIDKEDLERMHLVLKLLKDGDKSR